MDEREQKDKFGVISNQEVAKRMSSGGWLAGFLINKLGMSQRMICPMEFHKNSESVSRFVTHSGVVSKTPLSDSIFF